MKFKVWSNTFFLVPLAAAVHYELFLHAGIIATVTLASSAHHCANEHKFGLVDRALALTLIGYNLYVFYLANFRQPHFLIALLFVGLAFYMRSKQTPTAYNWYHSWWHASSAVITTLAILAVGTT